MILRDLFDSESVKSQILDISYLGKSSEAQVGKDPLTHGAYLPERKARSPYRPVVHSRGGRNPVSSKRPRNFIAPFIGATENTASFCSLPIVRKRKRCVGPAQIRRSRIASIRSVQCGR